MANTKAKPKYRKYWKKGTWVRLKHKRMLGRILYPHTGCPRCTRAKGGYVIEWSDRTYGTTTTVEFHNRLLRATKEEIILNGLTQ